MKFNQDISQRVFPPFIHREDPAELINGRDYVMDAMTPLVLTSSDVTSSIKVECSAALPKRSSDEAFLFVHNKARRNYVGRNQGCSVIAADDVIAINGPVLIMIAHKCAKNERQELKGVTITH